MPGCRNVCIADLHAANLFVKAKSKNDSASRFELFLEQGFNGCAVSGLALASRRVGTHTITPLLSSELPLPQTNLPINNSGKKSKIHT